MPFPDVDETSKSRRHWGPLEIGILQGSGIDIGCGPDPVTPTVRRFDVTDGDANQITRFVSEQFDFVYSSHCLEHMKDPPAALRGWWSLVKPGGHLFFIVPDEDLYEQGVFPSRFNPDHKATFTIAKARSWSHVSFNVLDLARALPGGEIVRLELQDQGYDRRLLRHGENRPISAALRFAFRAYHSLRHRGLFRIALFERWQARFVAIDQTARPDALAQIQCIVRKTAGPSRGS
ncbi:MAG: class I SAM-dependent methyltransferase [Verrucomicrobia bacterium]|nr:class I SAM-dependent methyltransferase [Verrucomicrobiota bacterium]